MDKILTFFAAPTNTNYVVNRLESNVVFNLGGFVIIILLAFLILTGVIGFIARITGQTRLDIETEKWTSRFLMIFLYGLLFWLGLSMIISYAGNSLLDIVTGGGLILGAVISIIQRATSNQSGANRSLAFTFIFFVVMLIWSFIYGAVMDALPAEFMDSIGHEFHADFFNDMFRTWGWM